MLDSEIAQVCASIYDTASSWEFVWTKDDVYVAMKNNIIVFRGSCTPLDWFRDFQADLFLHPILGGIERGFSEGADDVFTEIMDRINQDTIITGHSLGAARAVIFAGLVAAKGIRCARTVVFGSPRPGLAKLAEILLPTAIHSYKNRNDLVTDVPLPLLGSWYVHPRAATHINCADPADHGLLCDHHINLYVKGIQALESQAT